MCARSSLEFWRCVLLAVALLWVLSSAAAQDMPPELPQSEQSMSDMSSESPQSMQQRWDALEARLETLYSEANLSSMDWDELLTELAQVRAEAEKLRSDSERSSKSFEAYEQRTNERIAFIEKKAKERIRAAERSRDLWRVIGVSGLAMLFVDIILRILSI